ncbi:hypothetical protein HZ326_23661 [Fusarium oxysporum f. sp. albedinis]|nr:hypothetical protein HZ326_23661 [Fusarium oxysporum f. sp. albedinis]
MDIIILYCHNMRKSISYGLYCNILLYCHTISNTVVIKVVSYIYVASLKPSKNAISSHIHTYNINKCTP